MVPKGFIIILLFIATILIVYQLTKNTECEQKENVIIRYIPKTMDEEAKYGVSEQEIFKTLFSRPSPWVELVGSYDTDKNNKIRKYFISQS